MKVVIDIEADGLFNPTHIWLIVCKDILTGSCHVFRNLTKDSYELERFNVFRKSVTLWIGHNLLGYDCAVIKDLTGIDIVSDDCANICDTLILSKVIDYSGRKAHSIENYGLEFGTEKGKFSDWSKYSKEMEEYCIRDVDICHKIYLKYLRYISKEEHKPSILLEHQFQRIVNDLTTNGFSFNTLKATKLLSKVQEELSKLDEDILKEFPPKLKLIREVTPKETKHGTISRISIPKALGTDLSPYSPGASFSYCAWSTFNPASHKQIIDVLSTAGWRPIERTKAAIDNAREINRLKHSREDDPELDIRLRACYDKERLQKKYGFKINEVNLNTLPKTAPAPARTLAKRILLEARRRTLTEWLGLVDPDTSRIHGKFYGLGAWTHRMAHQAPNTANIPNEFALDGSVKLYGKEMRSLWQAPKNRLLVGVDAEGIQLRIFAHYIDDPEFTEALVKGRKEDKSDPHSLNKSILGSVCKSRAAAKRFIYALLLGAGGDKLAQILECSREEADAALARLISRYSGFELLKTSIIPADAKRGWFTGLDGRAVRIPGDTTGQRRHLCMSGYLQNGETTVMKKATVKWYPKVRELHGILVNFVHDEWQTECPNNMEVAIEIAKTQSDSLREVGEELNLKCPLAGSYWNDDHHDYTIGTNWSVTH